MKIKKPIHKSRLLAFKGEKLLVLEKVGLKKRYTLAGGVRKKKESDCQSLIRETKEEIGVLLKKEDLSYFITRRNITKDRKEVLKHYFIAIKKIRKPLLLEPEKFKRVTWVPWYEAVNYLDKEDRSAVTLYCDQFIRKAN